jgi:hypothetical protein
MVNVHRVVAIGNRGPILGNPVRLVSLAQSRCVEYSDWQTLLVTLACRDPVVVLRVDVEDVSDTEHVALPGAGQRVIRFAEVVTSDHRQGEFKCFTDRLVGIHTGLFEIKKLCVAHYGFPTDTVSSRQDHKELKLEAFDLFVALFTVVLQINLYFFAGVELILLEGDLGRRLTAASNAHNFSDLMLALLLLIDRVVRLLRPVNQQLSAASIKRDVPVFLREIFINNGAASMKVELRPTGVLDTKLFL